MKAELMPKFSILMTWQNKFVTQVMAFVFICNDVLLVPVLFMYTLTRQAYLKNSLKSHIGMKAEPMPKFSFLLNIH